MKGGGLRLRLRKVLQKNYYKVGFLKVEDRIPGEVSAVIATYNRCPCPPGNPTANPLELALWTLLRQEGVHLREVIIVDDHSQDHTRPVVERLRWDFEEAGIKLVYVHNRKRWGSSVSRNIGIERADGDFVYINDDDCVISPHAIYGGLRAHYETGGVVNLPVYYRATVPTEAKPIGEIGRVDLEKGVKSGNLDAFPLEYLRRERFLDEREKILLPVEIQDLNAHILAPREALEEAGGFPEDLPWRNSFLEESELALRLLDSGYRLFLLPDPKFQAVHLRFGHRGRAGLIGEDWLGGMIGRAVAEADIPRDDTGNRLEDAREYYKTKIVATFVFFWKRDPGGARRYLRRELETLESFDRKYYDIDGDEARDVIRESLAEIEGVIGEGVALTLEGPAIR